MTEPAGEPWRPVRTRGDDTVEIFTLLDELEPRGEERGEPGAERDRPRGRD